MVFVTHGVDEPVLLANRVLFMGATPGHIVEGLRIDLPRPRSADMTTTPETARSSANQASDNRAVPGADPGRRA